MDLEKIIEALLFVSGEALAIKDLVRLSGHKRSAVEEALGKLKNSLRGRGIHLVELGEEVSLATAPEVSEITGRFAKERLEGNLSRSALETLAVILWKGKVSRSSIDYIRGVNSSFSLGTLLVRGLIEREQNPKDARVYLYSPTLQLLKYLGITSLKELPDFDEIKKELKDYD